MKSKEVSIPTSQAFYMAAEEVLLNMPFENKQFNPKDRDECVRLLEELVEKGHLSLDWIGSVAGAHMSNAHTFIELSKDWKWNYLGGMSKATTTREEFLDHVVSVLDKMSTGNITVKNNQGAVIHEGPWGKNYFGKKK